MASGARPHSRSLAPPDTISRAFAGAATAARRRALGGPAHRAGLHLEAQLEDVDVLAVHVRAEEAATDGESSIPLDEATRDTVRAAGYDLDDVLPYGVELRVRRTANLHTGGTIHDVTAQLHPALVTASVRASRALDIPVTGLDFLVPDLAGPDHVLIEANERPGLANHQPQPTAERFVDLLFPETTALPTGWQPAPAPASQ